MSVSQSLFNRAPYWMQHVAFNAYALTIHRERYGRHFQQVLQELEETEKYSKSEIEAYQNLHLRKLVDHAYNTVPFYNNLYKQHKIAPSDIRTVSDLEKLPFITRADLLAKPEQFLSRMVSSRDLSYGHTSGTTGSPLTVGWDKETCIYTNAVDWRQKRWAGVNYGEPIALLLGRQIVSPKRTKPPFWQLDRVHNQLWMSSFHMSGTYLPSYVEKLRETKVVAIEGYPSTIYILARYLQSIGDELPLRAVFTSSEVLHPFQRELIEQVFQCTVFDFYGMAERMVFATQCGKGSGYHLNFEYAVNEIVSQDGMLSDRGYLVGTSIRNFGMPLIRYKTSDVVEREVERCPCNRLMPRLKEVLGRDESILVVPGGKLVSNSVLTPPFKEVGGIIESQILQETVNEITVRIVADESFSLARKEKLTTLLKERIGAGVSINVVEMQAIPREASGKFTWLISKVPLSF